MNRFFRARALARRDESGVALITVILMLALMSALTLTVAVVTTNNLVSARLAQQAGSAVNASDAGVAQAVTYLRQKGVRGINGCSPSCTSNPWGNSTSPATVTINGKAAQSYKVWIEPIAPYPANKPGLYRIHSTGVAGGPAGRSVTVDVRITPLDFVMGVMAASVVGGGDAGVHYESIFSTGCIYQRSKIEFQGIDAAYQIPAAVHTSQIITDSNGSGKTCPDTNKPIHDPTKVGEAKNCNIDDSGKYRYDEDKNGGALATTGSCYDYARIQYPTATQFSDPSSPAYRYPTTSFTDEATLASRYKAKRPVFTQSQLDQLKSIAVSQNSYWTTSKFRSASQPTGWTIPTDPDSVLYFDLTATDPGGMVDLNDLTSNLPDGSPSPWIRTTTPPLSATSALCPSRSLLVIIEGGNARLNSNSNLAGSVFLVSDDPYGNITKANGTSTFTGNIYANNIDLTGTSDLYMDACFMANVSPALARVDTFDYREVDR
jgi:Tfp pilus assembly protein PilX